MPNSNPGRRTLCFAGLLGALGVLLGAFTAHGLDGWLASQGLQPELVARRVAQMDTGVRYHLLHTVALLALAAAAPHHLSARLYRLISAFWIAGILLFSGSLYLLVALNLPQLGAVTPLGGLSLILAWLILAFAAFTSEKTVP